jgi:hypothetical protein
VAWPLLALTCTYAGFSPSQSPPAGLFPSAAVFPFFAALPCGSRAIERNG